MQHAPGFLRLVDEARTRIVEVSCAEVAELLERGETVVLIDVREHAEWMRGRLPKARHLCKGIIERDIEAAVPDPDAPIVLYCGGGFRSALAADALAKMGYRRVRSMAGGWRAWIEAELPVVSGE